MRWEAEADFPLTILGGYFYPDHPQSTQQLSAQMQSPAILLLIASVLGVSARNMPLRVRDTTDGMTSTPTLTSSCLPTICTTRPLSGGTWVGCSDNTACPTTAPTARNIPARNITSTPTSSCLPTICTTRPLSGGTWIGCSANTACWTPTPACTLKVHF
jgi:hypothetical protein